MYHSQSHPRPVAKPHKNDHVLLQHQLEVLVKRKVGTVRLRAFGSRDIAVDSGCCGFCSGSCCISVLIIFVLWVVCSETMKRLIHQWE
jgi:hypothetical protein